MRGGPRGFRPGFPCPAVLRYSLRKSVRFRLQGRYLLWRDFPFTSANAWFCNSATRRQADQVEPYNPHTTTAAAYHVVRVWADPLSLATTQGVEVSFLSSGYLDVSVPQLGPRTLCIQIRVLAHYHQWVSPFGNPGITDWSASPPGLSQPPTSFIASRCQGIHRVPLFS